MPTGFLPIDPSLPSCERGDDMGRKIGMTWLLPTLNYFPVAVKIIRLGDFDLVKMADLQFPLC